MSFQPPNARQELQNRKILEELQQQKKMLQNKQAIPSALPSVVAAPPTGHVPVEGHVLTTSQRTALQHAHAHSVGYFITQDSSFGNLILPVIPRIENKTPDKHQS